MNPSTLPVVLALGAAAALISLALTPPLIRWVTKIGFVDKPGERKVHAQPMPTGGGLAVAAAFFAVLWAGSFLQGSPDTVALLGLTIVGAISLKLGLLDDRFGLPAWIKLIVQAGCAVILHALGFGVDRVSNPFGGEPIDLGGVGVLLDVVWVLLVVNAVNVIDGLDGLASGIVVIALASLVAVAYGHADGSVVWVGTILAGATLGFLRWNFPPAKIFLGDTGSQFLGMMMAAVALLENNKGTAAVTLLLPIVAMGVPILDSALAFFRRLGRGGRIFKADREHLHHRLLELGLTHRQAVMLHYYACAYLGIAAYVLSLLPRRAVLLVLLLLAMGGVGLLETLKFVGRRRDSQP